MSKQERYFSGMPPERDPNKPLPGELPAGSGQLMKLTIGGVAAVGLGVVIGIAMGPEGNKEKDERIAGLQESLEGARAEITELKMGLKYKETAKIKSVGTLDPQHRVRHMREGQRYTQALRAAGAQPAADLMEWFVTEWNHLLDFPQDDDRVNRRAAALNLLVGGMAKNLNPDDYVPWQAEVLGGKWLGELHFDIDGDGLPAKRSAKNRKDGFLSVSVCHVAMALNQSVTDAQVLVMPNMRCDRRENKLSLFLGGETYNDALNEFVRGVRREGFLVVEKKKKGVRLILVGKKSG